MIRLRLMNSSLTLANEACGLNFVFNAKRSFMSEAFIHERSESFMSEANHFVKSK